MRWRFLGGALPARCAEDFRFMGNPAAVPTLLSDAPAAAYAAALDGRYGLNPLLVPELLQGCPIGAAAFLPARYTSDEILTGTG